MISSRFRVVLCALNVSDNDIGGGTKGTELGEIQLCSIEYAINSVPRATVKIPTGARMNEDGVYSESFSGSSGTLPQYADSRKPVGIFVQIGDADGYSHSARPSGEFCLFKGFIQDNEYEISSTGTHYIIHLAHWLSSLSMFSLRSTLAAPRIARDLGRQFILSASIADSVADRHSGSIQPYIKDAKKQLLSTHFDLWEVFKSVILRLLPQNFELKDDTPGYVSRHLFEQTRKALERVKSMGIEFVEKMDAEEQLIHAIASYLLREHSYDGLIGVTAWDQAVRRVFPEFYLSIVPMVDRAVVIPTPGQGMSVAACERNLFTVNDYLSVSYKRAANPVIGGVIVWDTNNGRNIAGTKHAFSTQYPPEIQPGPIESIKAPSWTPYSYLQASAGGLTLDNRHDFYNCYKLRNDRMEREAAKIESGFDDKSVYYRTLFGILARTAYQILAFNSRICGIVAPFRVDILPGDQIAIEVPEAVKNTLRQSSPHLSRLYGTVSAVVFNISESGATTSYEMANIRSENEMINPYLTSKTGLYQSAWREPAQQNLKLISNYDADVRP